MFTKITPLAVLNSINELNTFFNNDERILKIKKEFQEKKDFLSSEINFDYLGKDKDYTLYVEVPGFTKNDLDITYNDVESNLVITGSIKEPYDSKINRTFTIDNTKYEIGSVKLENGLLQIEVKLKEEVKGKEIKINID